MSMGANLFHQFHQRTVGSPEAPSSQEAADAFIKTMTEIVASGVPAGAVVDAVLEGDNGQMEVWLGGITPRGAKG